MVELARGAGARIALDLASFEVVRAFRPALLALLRGGAVDLAFSNEDEASELARGLPPPPGTAANGDGNGGEAEADGAEGEGAGAEGTPDAGLQILAAHCLQAAVVTLGEKVRCCPGAFC